MTITGKSSFSGTHYWRAWKVGQIYNGSAYEDYSSGSYASYDIAGTDEGLGWFSGTIPDDCDKAELVYQSGGSPASGDLVAWVSESNLVIGTNNDKTGYSLVSIQTLNVSGQQQSNFRITRGNSYSATSRVLSFVKLANVDWPTDISSGWTWTLWSERHGSNGNSGADTITGTVSVVVATGDSRELALAITSTNTTALAEGLYKFALRGTNGSSEVWDVVKGIVTVED